MYKSLTAQSLHYFSRPQENILRTPLLSPAAWKGSELASKSEWREPLTTADIVELESAIKTAKRTGRPTERLSKKDFPLKRMTPKLDRWRAELSDGRGFHVVTGVPVARWGQADTELFFWCFGLHLGVPGAQNPQGDLLGHVRDTGESASDPHVRHYRTSANISFHCDAADVVGLLCLNKAKRGGKSRIVSSVSVYNEVLRRRPDLVERLYQPFLLDTHGEGGVSYIPIPPCRYADGRLRTFYHSDYFRTVSENTGAPPLTGKERTLLYLYDEIASSPDFHLDMDLQPGDIQLQSNHTQLHARTDYEDHPEPARKRHLLRLWISLPSPRSLGARLRTERSRVAMVANLGRLRVKTALQRVATRQ